MKIAKIKARQILDSRGNPTIECDVILENGIMGRAAVPSGASTGSHEALEKRDKNPDHYNGQSVLSAVRNVEEIVYPLVSHLEVCNQREIDLILKRTGEKDNYKEIGAEAVLSVSMACSVAAANNAGLPLYRYLGDMAEIARSGLPLPMMNVINGGAHANFVTDIQEFMIVPVGARSFSEALEMGAEVYHFLGLLLKQRGYETATGDEGGYAISFTEGNHEAIESLLTAIQMAGFKSGREICLALDLAASEFFNGVSYNLKSEHKEFKGEAYLAWVKDLISEFSILSVEDPFNEEDRDSWKELVRALGQKVMIVGDDLTVTSQDRLLSAIEEKLCNGVIIKPNQVGTITDTLATIEVARQNGLKTIVSHRSGETSDTFVAHLAVGVNSGLVKFGAPARGERLAKYNELLRIEEELGSNANFNKWPI